MGDKAMHRHCQVVGDDMVTRHQQALSGRAMYRPDAEAARVLPVMSAHLAKRVRLSARSTAADRRCRLGRQGWAMGPEADKKRGACPAALHPCMRYARWRGGRWECSPRLLRSRLCRCATPGRRSRGAAPALFHFSVMLPRGTDWSPVSS